jgi:TetR/AcrR family transcriptional repressor of nem operon
MASCRLDGVTGNGMARPREFDEGTVLDAAVQCFWSRGYEATSVRDLVEQTGIAGASLYNAFGDKSALYRKALDHYVGRSVADRIRRCEQLDPQAAIRTFFDEVIARSLADPECKGCMLVNTALEVTPRTPELQEAVARVLDQIESFFRRCVETGQADGRISRTLPADDLARHFLGILLGLRVLARVRPERALLEGAVRPALSLLDPGTSGPGTG